MKRKRFRKSEIRDFNEKVSVYGYHAGKKDDVELVENDGMELIAVNGEMLFFYHEGRPIPTLKLLLEGADMKRIVVDMGAVKFMASGADVMRPGIIDIDEKIEAGDAVVVLDENNRRPLAVCIAMYDGGDMKAMESGKVLRNIHHIGDDIWQFEI